VTTEKITTVGTVIEKEVEKEKIEAEKRAEIEAEKEAEKEGEIGAEAGAKRKQEIGAEEEGEKGVKKEAIHVDTETVAGIETVDEVKKGEITMKENGNEIINTTIQTKIGITQADRQI